MFAILSVATAGRQWKSDLVKSRRRLRRFIVVTGTAYTLTMLALRMASPQGRLSEESSMLDVVFLMVIVGGALWKLPRLHRLELFVLPSPQTQILPHSHARTAGESAADTPDSNDKPLTIFLHQAITQDHAYRSEDLTIARLAQRLKTPEYRLRSVINQRLGHRSFNAYVNAFRIDEAKAALANPAQRNLPVLSIALESGLQTIGPFNRAFKAATGLTPSEFRKQNNADF